MFSFGIFFWKKKILLLVVVSSTRDRYDIGILKIWLSTTLIARWQLQQKHMKIADDIFS
jgi:hypothetical protein